MSDRPTPSRPSIEEVVDGCWEGGLHIGEYPRHRIINAILAEREHYEQEIDDYRLAASAERRRAEEAEKRIAELRAEVNAEWAWCVGLLKRSADLSTYDHEASVHNEALDNLIREMENELVTGPPKCIAEGIARMRAEVRAEVEREVVRWLRLRSKEAVKGRSSTLPSIYAQCIERGEHRRKP